MIGERRKVDCHVIAFCFLLFIVRLSCSLFSYCIFFNPLSLLHLLSSSLPAFFTFITFFYIFLLVFFFSSLLFFSLSSFFSLISVFFFFFDLMLLGLLMCFRWYLGIQSKKDPAHVMTEVYKAMQALRYMMAEDFTIQLKSFDEAISHLHVVLSYQRIFLSFKFLTFNLCLTS